MSKNMRAADPNRSLEQILPFSHITAKSNKAQNGYDCPWLKETKKDEGEAQYLLQISKFIEITSD